MSSEFATRVPERVARRRSRTTRRQRKALAVLSLGPATMLAGIVWAFLQPHRIVFLDPAGKGAYDFLAQPPLLVVVVGLVFSLVVAPGLVEDLEAEEGADGPAA